MEDRLAEVKFLNTWMNEYIQPGGVCSVGGAQITERYRRSNGEMAQDFREYNRDIGSNPQDGENLASTRYETGARINHEAFNNKQKEPWGWRIQDLKNVDRSTMEMVGHQPQYGWRNTVARVYKAATTGEAFLPLPGGYSQKEGQTPRGGLVPQILQTGNNTSSGNLLNRRIYTGLNLGKPTDYSTTAGGLTFQAPSSKPTPLLTTTTKTT